MFRSFVSLLAFALFVPAAYADSPAGPKAYSPSQQIVASDAQRDDYFGWSVAASGNRVVVGVPYDMNVTVPTPGSAYLLERAEGVWNEVVKLTPADGAAFDAFGEAVALEGELALIGAADHEGARGAAYLYRNISGSWQLSAKLVASDRVTGARFGKSVAISSDTIAVGASGYSQGRGAVYIFRWNGVSWLQEQRIQANDAASGDSLGHSIAISGDHLVSGAPLRDDVAQNQGAAYAFSRSGSVWTQRAKWQGSSPVIGEQFGWAVALDQDLAAVGAPFATRSGAAAAGAVQTYIRSGSAWALETALQGSAPSEGAQFGFAVAVRGSRLLVGLAGESIGGNILQGSLESFLRVGSAWQPYQRMLAQSGQQEDQLGYSVALTENFAVAGAPASSRTSMSYEGAVHAFLNLETSTSLATIVGQPVRIGESYRVQASVTVSEGAATGSLEISDDAGGSCSAPLDGGSGSCSLSASAVGLRQITARYSGAPGLAESFASTTVQVAPDLRFTPSTLPEAQIGRPFTAVLDSAATGATLPLSYSVVSGSLPLGLSLGASGSVSGTPGAFGSFNFGIRLTDSSDIALGGPFSETRSFTLIVQPPFTTSLVLLQPATSGDRGQSQTFAAELAVIEDGAAAPSGTFVVTATHQARVLSCSSAVSAEGPQSCSIGFGLGDPAGDYTISARFESSNADYAGSQSSGSHRLFAAADPSSSVEAADATWVEGQSLRFRLRVQNSGPDAALGLRVQFDVDSTLNDLAWTCTGADCPAPSGSGALDTLLASLAAGSELQFELAGTAAAAASGAITASAAVELELGGFGRELDPDNNADSASSLPLKIFGDGFELPQT